MKSLSRSTLADTPPGELAGSASVSSMASRIRRPKESKMGSKDLGEPAFNTRATETACQSKPSGPRARSSSERRHKESFARVPTALRPSRPIQQWVTHQAEKELTSLLVLRYGSENKIWFKIPIHMFLSPSYRLASGTGCSNWLMILSSRLRPCGILTTVTDARVKVAQPDNIVAATQALAVSSVLYHRARTG
jgi:hypothetical protein